MVYGSSESTGEVEMRKLFVVAVLMLSSAGGWAIDFGPYDLLSSTSGQVLGSFKLPSLNFPTVPPAGTTSYYGASFVSLYFFGSFYAPGVITFHDQTPVSFVGGGDDSVEFVGGGYTFSSIRFMGTAFSTDDLRVESFTSITYRLSDSGTIVFPAAVPEHSILSLMLAGLGVGGALARRRRAPARLTSAF